MITSVEKTVIILAIICVLTMVVLYMIFWDRSEDTWWHPYPTHNEVYEATDPDTQEPVIRLVTTKWTDGSRNFCLMFRQVGGTIWYIRFRDSEYPGAWWLCPDNNLDKKVLLNQIHDYLPVGEVRIESWLDIDKLGNSSLDMEK